MPQKSKLENINEYNANPNSCKYCGKYIYAKHDDILRDVKIKKFCNRSCAASYNNANSESRPKSKKSNCLNCGKEIRYGNKYCSNKCQVTYKYENYINDWKAGRISGSPDNDWKSYSGYIRTYLFEKYNNKCARCGGGEQNRYSKKVPLEIDHIDGDATNNQEENLILLCPNCHSLTSTYKGLNKGKSTRKITWVPKIRCNLSLS